MPDRGLALRERLERLGGQDVIACGFDRAGASLHRALDKVEAALGGCDPYESGFHDAEQCIPSRIGVLRIPARGRGQEKIVEQKSFW